MIKYKIGTAIFDPLYINHKKVIGIITDVTHYRTYNVFVYKATFQDYSLWLSESEIELGTSYFEEYRSSLDEENT